MTIKLGVLMDPIASIHIKKDSTMAMLWEAQDRAWEIYYFEQPDIFLRDGKAYGQAKRLTVFRDQTPWFSFAESHTIALSDLDILLMRKDPPFNMEYIYTTYILEQAERDGVWVVNKPQSLRDFNEKCVTSLFPHCSVATLISSDMHLLKQFLQEQQDIIIKPLDGMGGSSIFRLQYPDLNASSVIELLTRQGSCHVMAQRFIADIVRGDKRILMIDGKPVPYALARVPAVGELRGNLAAGATGVAQPLTERDQWICEQIGPFLRQHGLYFVGLDVIGDYLTEINVTSPTCIRELDAQCGSNIAGVFLDFLEKLEI